MYSECRKLSWSCITAADVSSDSTQNNEGRKLTAPSRKSTTALIPNIQMSYKNKLHHLLAMWGGKVLSFQVVQAYVLTLKQRNMRVSCRYKILPCWNIAARKAVVTAFMIQQHASQSHAQPSVIPLLHNLKCRVNVCFMLFYFIEMKFLSFYSLCGWDVRKHIAFSKEKEHNDVFL